MRLASVVTIVSLSAHVTACVPISPSRSPNGVTPSASLLTVEQVLAQYYEAIGGYDRLRAVRTRRMRGHYTEGSLHAATEVLQERPLLRRVSLFTPKFDHIEGFDGQTWEYHRDANQSHGHLVRDTIGGPAELAGRRGAEFDESFVDYRERGFNATLLGRASLGELEVYRVRIIRNDNWTLDYYFDVYSHLLIAKQKAMPLHAEGPDVESITFNSDWRFVSGLLVPFAGEERNTKTGAIMNTLLWETVEFNVPLKRADLLPPSD